MKTTLELVKAVTSREEFQPYAEEAPTELQLAVLDAFRHECELDILESFQAAAHRFILDKSPLAVAQEMVEEVRLILRPKQPFPNQNWCVGCTPDTCQGCRL